MVSKKAQFRIQQMAFMIVAVFFFFILVGVAYISYQYNAINQKYQELQKEEAMRSLQILTNMPEIGCSQDYMCIDEDKIYALTVKKGYGNTYFWPIASIRVYKIYPAFENQNIISCPAPNCNYYDIYDSGQKNVQEYATYVSLCKKVREGGYTFDRCEIGKLSVGVKLNEKAE